MIYSSKTHSMNANNTIIDSKIKMSFIHSLIAKYNYLINFVKKQEKMKINVGGYNMKLKKLFDYRRSGGAFQAKTTFLPRSCFAVLAIAIFLGLGGLPYKNCAEAIVYSGSINDLQNTPTWCTDGGSQSFFPGTTDNPIASGNNLIIDYDDTAPGVTRPGNAFGGLSKADDAQNNSLSIIKGTVTGYVYGGWSSDGSTIKNTVNISGGSVGSRVYGGYSDNNGNSTNNIVAINGGSVGRDVIGGYSSIGNAVNNSVTVDGGFVGWWVYGGYSVSGDTVDNSTSITGGHIGRNIYGARSEKGSATGNKLTISGGTVDNDAFGAVSNRQNSVNNIVIMNGGFVGNNIVGGYSETGYVEGNSVTIEGTSTVGNNVYGGFNRSGATENNMVAISGGNIKNDVYGGLSDSGTTTKNTVIIDGGTIINDILGGKSYGSAIDNSVVMSDGLVGQDIIGGLSTSSGSTNNTVSISGGIVSNNVCGGFGVEGAEDNHIVITGGSIGGTAFGGYANGAAGIAAGNTISIAADGLVRNNVYGGLGYGGSTDNGVIVSGGVIEGNIYGGWGDSGSAEQNAVNISDGDVKGIVYGGKSVNGDATSNIVDISGGSIERDIYGGYSEQGNATYNTITIAGDTVFSANTGIRGGYVYSGGGDAFTGNTLNFKSSSISVASVANFQYYNFYLPNGTEANDVMLSVTDAVDLAGTTVEVFLQGSVTLQTGDRVALINSSYDFTSSPLNDSSTASLGAFINYDFDIYTENDNLWAELTSATTSPQSDILTDSRLASLAFLSQGTDLAASIECLEVSGDRRFNAFAVMGGGSSTYDTGMQADVDVNGFSMLAGIMWDVPVDRNRLIMSAFFEAGWGSYDTYRDFGGGNVIRGDGDTDYYGGGLYMRYQWNSGVQGGLYADASLRIGYATSNFNTNDLASVSHLRYDSGSAYYGGHLGLGYVWSLDSKNRLEATSKYLWTHLGSDEVTTSAGDRINFNSVNSRRLRTGFRLYHDFETARVTTLYYGAAYEYEFDGDADARLGGFSLDGSSLSGGSGVGELGVIFMPSKDNDRLLMRLGVQGYVGAREGVSCILKLQYVF